MQIAHFHSQLKKDLGPFADCLLLFLQVDLSPPTPHVKKREKNKKGTEEENVMQNFFSR